eukprot:5143668-Amphidinium_carterae.3
MESFMKSVYEVCGLQKSNSASAPGVKSLNLFPHQGMSHCISQITRDSELQKELSRKFSAPTSRMSQQLSTSSDISHVLRT